jgi:hypothetical protein
LPNNRNRDQRKGISEPAGVNLKPNFAKVRDCCFGMCEIQEKCTARKRPQYMVKARFSTIAVGRDLTDWGLCDKRPFPYKICNRPENVETYE